MKKRPVSAEAKQTHLISKQGERGPRIDVVMAMFDRMLEYEEEVARGERIPQYILQDGNVVAVGAALPKVPRKPEVFDELPN